MSTLYNFSVCKGGVYLAETVPGTGLDPVTLPSPVSWLDGLFLSIGCNTNLNEFRAISNKHAEDFDSSISNGTWIQVKDNYVSGSGSSGHPKTIFDGIVVNRHIVISGESERTEIICYDHGSYLLHRIAIHGQWRRDYKLEDLFYTNGPTLLGLVELFPENTGLGGAILIDTQCVFNPNGEPNMTVDRFYNSAEGAEANVPQFPLFEVPFRQQVNNNGTALVSEYWTIRDAVTYLLNMYPASWGIDPESYTFDKINGYLNNGNPIITNVSCEGKSLSQALTEILAPHNYSFWVDPALNSNNLHNFNIFCKGKGQTTSIYLDVRNTSSAVSGANLIQVDLLMDNAGTINNIDSYGDRVNVTTLACTNPQGSNSGSGKLPLLVQGWDDNDLIWPNIDGTLDTDSTGQINWYNALWINRYCNKNLLTPGELTTDNPVWGVGRLWLVNLGESPSQTLENLNLDLTGSGSSSYSSSGSIDFTNEKLTGNNNIDPRRFERPELFTGNSVGGILNQENIVVEMSTNSGHTWEIVDRSEYSILPDSLGLIFNNQDINFLGFGDSGNGELDGSGSTGSSSWFGKGYWQALYDGTLQLRVLCVIKSDEKVHAGILNDGTSFPLAIGAVYNNPGYKRNQYNEKINQSIYYTDFPPYRVNIDDTFPLLELTQTQMDCTNRTQVSGSARVLLDGYNDYTLGQVVNQILNRTINLSSGSDPGPTIVHITYKFQEGHTELTLDNHRVASIIRSKNMSHHIHKNTDSDVTVNPGGTKQNFLPMTSSGQGNYEAFPNENFGDQ